MLAGIDNPTGWIRIDGNRSHNNFHMLKGPHHQTKKGLFKSVAYGCTICARLKDAVDLAAFPAIYRYNKENPHWLNYEVNFQSRSHRGPAGLIDGCFHLYFRGSSADDSLTRLAENPLIRFTGRELESEYVTAPEDCDLPDSTGDARVIETAREWLSKCTSSNHSCPTQLQPESYPARLLHLDAEMVRLVETKDTKISDRYVTLSYCWGRNPQHLTLTTQNIDMLRRGIPSADLAKTFREAIQVTQSLGLKYLWIDALCILQSGEGCREDWENHVVEMSTIYANCLLNIAVDHGESAQAGCFLARDPDSIQPCIVEISSTFLKAEKGLREEKDPGQPEAYHLVDEDFWTQLLMKTPLLRRGWVHQERLLSPRILHFGRQISWECSDLVACESFRAGLQSIVDEPKITFSYHGTTPDQWYGIIEAYATTSLTNPQDKLPAIAGIAKRVSVQRGNLAYAAGIFLQDLPGSLLWRHEDQSPGGVVDPYRAPSWSWASRDGGVFYYRLSTADGASFIAQVTDTSIVYHDESNIFGRVKSGSLKITGRMLRMWLEEDDLRKRIWLRGFQLYSMDSDELMEEFYFLQAHVFFDESILVRARSRLAFLFIAQRQFQFYGLILAPNQKSMEDKLWSRVGIFYIGNNKKDLTWEFNRLSRFLERYPKTSIELI